MDDEGNGIEGDEDAISGEGRAVLVNAVAGIAVERSWYQGAICLGAVNAEIAKGGVCEWFVVHVGWLKGKMGEERD